MALLARFIVSGPSQLRCRKEPPSALLLQIWTTQNPPLASYTTYAQASPRAPHGAVRFYRNRLRRFGGHSGPRPVHGAPDSSCLSARPVCARPALPCQVLARRVFACRVFASSRRATHLPRPLAHHGSRRRAPRHNPHRAPPHPPCVFPPACSLAPPRAPPLRAFPPHRPLAPLPAQAPRRCPARSSHRIARHLQRSLRPGAHPRFSSLRACGLAFRSTPRASRSGRRGRHSARPARNAPRSRFLPS